MASPRSFSKSNRAQVVALSAAMLAALAIDAITPRGFSDWVLYVLVLIAATRVVDNLSLKLLAVVASGCTVLGCLLSPPGQPVWVSVFSRLLALVLLWAIVWMELHWRHTDERLRRLEQAVDGSNEIVFMTDPKGVITFINPAFTQTYGYTADEVVGMATPRILKGGQVAPDVYRVFWERLLEKLAVRGEFVNKTKDGRLLTFDAAASAILDARGHITGFLGIQRDVTEHKRADAALRENERKYRELVQHANSIILHWTREGRILFLNEFGQRFFGYTAAEICGAHVIGTIVPETALDGENLSRLMDDICADPASFEQNINENMRRNGERVWIAWTNKVVPGEQGQEAKILSIGTDITERKRSEEALKEYEKVVEGAQEMVMVVDRDYRFRIANHAFLAKRGLEYSQVVGRTMREVLVEPGMFESGIKGKLDECFQGEIVRSEMTYACARQGMRDISMAFYPIEGPAGIDRVACVMEDITEKLEAERQLKKTQEQFLQAQKMEAVGRLAGGVAHDFNNLLTIINGYTELLLENTHTESCARGSLEEIHRAGERAAALTRQLLTFSRKQVTEPAILDLNAIVEGAHKMLLRLIGEDIKFVTDLAADLSQIKADHGQVEQVIMNLVVNARDAMPKGGKLTIETANMELGEDYARSHPDVGPGSYVMLALSDTGCGMDAETQSHIFEPFYTTKGLGKGTGLGLSTVYGIVKQSGGHVNVYSEVGRGTTFRVYFPRMDQPTETTGEETDAPPMSGSETVLLVEDEPGVRGLTERVLRENGYTVLTATGPQEALRLATEFDGAIHLLLTDVVMPGMNGKELADRLALWRPEVAVLFTSGYAADAIGQHGILEQGVAFLPKPYAPRSLLGKIRETLGGNGDHPLHLSHGSP